MKLKKLNAELGLLSILILLIHAGYQVVAYIMFLYNPMVTKVLAWLTVAVVSLHAILGMSMVMFSHDGSAISDYPKANLRTILQRGSAIGIMIMLVLHIQSFGILKSGTLGLVAAELIQLLFFSFIFTHIATSFTNAFITLGILSDMDRRNKIDRAVWLLCGIAWIICVAVIGRTYVMLAAMP